MNFLLGIIVGVLGYMLINDPTILSDLLHGWGDWINEGTK